MRIMSRLVLGVFVAAIALGTVSCGLWLQEEPERVASYGDHVAAVLAHYGVALSEGHVLSRSTGLELEYNGIATDGIVFAGPGVSFQVISIERFISQFHARYEIDRQGDESLPALPDDSVDVAISSLGVDPQMPILIPVFDTEAAREEYQEVAREAFETLFGQPLPEPDSAGDCAPCQAGGATNFVELLFPDAEMPPSDGQYSARLPYFICIGPCSAVQVASFIACFIVSDPNTDCSAVSRIAFDACMFVCEGGMRIPPPEEFL